MVGFDFIGVIQKRCKWHMDGVRFGYWCQELPMESLQIAMYRFNNADLSASKDEKKNYFRVHHM